MTRSHPLVLVVLVSALACSSGEEKEAPPPAPVAELSNQETIAFENTPGSTPALEDATEPAPPPVAGIDGAPGPSPAFGPSTAPVRVYVLTDFQCPVCRRIVEPLKYLARRHPNEVRLIVKQNALPSHRNATAFAATSMAAFRQGKFWAYHDRLFANAGARRAGCGRRRRTRRHRRSRIACTGHSRRRRPTCCGLGTSPTSAPGRAGCTWRQCWTCSRAGRSGGPWPIICAPRWSATRCGWPSPRAAGTSRA